MMFYSNVPKYLNYVIRLKHQRHIQTLILFCKPFWNFVNRGDSISVLILQTLVLNQVHGYRFQ